MNLTSDSKSITKFKNIKKQLIIVWVGVNIWNDQMQNDRYFGISKFRILK